MSASIETGAAEVSSAILAAVPLEERLLTIATQICVVQRPFVERMELTHNNYSWQDKYPGGSLAMREIELNHSPKNLRVRHAMLFAGDGRTMSGILVARPGFRPSDLAEGVPITEDDPFCLGIYQAFQEYVDHRLMVRPPHPNQSSPGIWEGIRQLLHKAAKSPVLPDD
jgi:hypothetical protein